MTAAIVDNKMLTDQEYRQLVRARKANPPQLDPNRPTNQLIVVGETEWLGLLVEHRPGCTCSSQRRGKPAHMVDERSISHGRFDLYQQFQKELTEAGRPAGRIWEDRFNEAGARIGPRLEVRSCEGFAFLDLIYYVDKLVSKAAAKLSSVVTD